MVKCLEIHVQYCSLRVFKDVTYFFYGSTFSLELASLPLSKLFFVTFHISLHITCKFTSLFHWCTCRPIKIKMLQPVRLTAAWQPTDCESPPAAAMIFKCVSIDSIFPLETLFTREEWWGGATQKNKPQIESRLRFTYLNLPGPLCTLAQWTRVPTLT